MDRLKQIEGFVGAIEAARDFEEVFRILGAQASHLGFQRFAYWRLWPAAGPRRPLCLTNYPVEWARRYVEQGYANHDLVGRHSARTIRPFLWQEVCRVSELTAKQRLIFQEGGEVGLKAGASVPIHGPGTAKAVFSVANDMSNEDFAKLFLSWRHELQLIASYAHRQIIELVGRGVSDEASPLTQPGALLQGGNVRHG